MEKVFDIRRFIVYMVYFVNDPSDESYNDLVDILNIYNGGDLIRSQGLTIDQYIENEGKDCFIATIHRSLGNKYVNSMMCVRHKDHSKLSLEEAKSYLANVREMANSRRINGSDYVKVIRSLSYYRNKQGKVDKIKKYIRYYTSSWSNSGSKIAHISIKDLVHRFGYKESIVLEAIKELNDVGMKYELDEFDKDTYNYLLS